MKKVIDNLLFAVCLCSSMQLKWTSILSYGIFVLRHSLVAKWSPNEKKDICDSLKNGSKSDMVFVTLLLEQ